MSPQPTPPAFAHGDVRRWRRAGGLTLAEVVYAPGARVPWQRDEHARFVFVLRGGFSERVGRESRTCAASTLAFTPARTPYRRVVSEAGATCLVADVNAGWVAHAEEGCRLLDHPAVFRGGLLVHLARRLDGEFRRRDEVSRLVIVSLVLGIIAEALRRDEAARIVAAPPAWLEAVRLILIERFAEPLALADLAAVAGVHPTHLARAFRRWYRCTVGDFLRDLRLDFACRQIGFAGASIAEVALAAGFCDQSHLTRTFRRQLGVTPAEYRNACHGAPDPIAG